MIHEQRVYVPSSEKTVRHEVAPCVKCGSDDINIREYEDQYGCISTMTCKGCKQEVKVNASTVAVIKDWNERNNIERLLIKKTQLINETRDEIKLLRNLQRTRNKPLEKITGLNNNPSNKTY